MQRQQPPLHNKRSKSLPSILIKTNLVQLEPDQGTSPQDIIQEGNKGRHHKLPKTQQCPKKALKIPPNPLRIGMEGTANRATQTDPMPIPDQQTYKELEGTPPRELSPPPSPLRLRDVIWNNMYEDQMNTLRSTQKSPEPAYITMRPQPPLDQPQPYREENPGEMLYQNTFREPPWEEMRLIRLRIGQLERTMTDIILRIENHLSKEHIEWTGTKPRLPKNRSDTSWDKSKAQRTRTATGTQPRPTSESPNQEDYEICILNPTWTGNNQLIPAQSQHSSSTMDMDPTPKKVSTFKGEGPDRSSTSSQDSTRSSTDNRRIVNKTMRKAGSTRLEHYRTLGRTCLLYTSPSPRDGATARMPSSA